MSKVRTVSLRHNVPKDASLKFLRVELVRGGFTPFALVRYAEAGVEQPLGLRLDLDKRAFLDHFDDPIKEDLANRVSRKIVRLVGKRLRSRRKPSH